MLRPSFISLQTLLLLVAILQNGLEPKTAWATLSTTKALAQSLGLEIDRLLDSNGSGEVDPRREIGYELQSQAQGNYVNALTDLLLLGRTFTLLFAWEDGQLNISASISHIPLRN